MVGCLLIGGVVEPGAPLMEIVRSADNQSLRRVRRRRSETGILASDRKARHKCSFGVPQ